MITCCSASSPPGPVPASKVPATTAMRSAQNTR